MGIVGSVDEYDHVYYISSNRSAPYYPEQCIWHNIYTFNSGGKISTDILEAICSSVSWKYPVCKPLPVIRQKRRNAAW